jgi:hypothetical protein
MDAVNFAFGYDTALQLDLVRYPRPCFTVPASQSLLHSPCFTDGPDRILRFRPEDSLRMYSLVERLIELKEKYVETIRHMPEAIRSMPDWLFHGPRMRVP